MGSVGGGVWKTTNAGRTWLPIFDSQPIASIGAIAVAPSDAGHVYVGTGEADMRSQISYGNGMYKSTDAGKTWTHIGLDDTRQIGTRHRRSARSERRLRGGARTRLRRESRSRRLSLEATAAATWQKVLFKSNDVGAIDLAFEPANPQIDLRVAVEYAASAVERLSAVVRTGQRPLQVDRRRHELAAADERAADRRRRPDRHRRRADESAAASTRSSTPRTAACTDRTMPARRGRRRRATAASGAAAGISARSSSIRRTPISSTCSNTGVYRSRDGGKTFGEPFKGSPGGDDYHQLWIYPDDGNRMILGGDQGAVISVDGLAEHPTWSSWLNQPIARALPRRGRLQLSRTG